MPDTRNVKLGVCKVIYGGVDLGYTKGGVEVTVETETRKGTVDQFGSTAINEQIMGRSVAAKVPLAETTLDNLVAIMPGATKVGSAGKVQISTVTVTATSANAVLTIGGTNYTSVPDGTPTVGEHCLALVAAVNADVASPMTASTVATAASTSGTVVLTGKIVGQVSAVSMNGGTVAPTQAASQDNYRVDVTTGVGVNLLDLAKELRLHPKNLLDGDQSEDFVIPLAATPGGINFAYKLDDERIYNANFSGYPHPATDRLFYIGKTAAA